MALNFANAVVTSLIRENLGESVAQDLVRLLELAAGFATPLLIFTAVTFLLWFRRAYENAGVQGMRLLPGLGWSVGAWFVPVVNVVLPPMMANAMAKHAARSTGVPRRRVWPWFACWYAGGTLVLLSAAMSARAAGDFEAVRDALAVNAAGAVLAVAACGFAIRYVRWLTRTQERAQPEVAARVFGDAPPALPVRGAKDARAG